MTLSPTILCGGAGSRLWPVFRELHPKPFIRLADGQSLLQKAWLRGAVLPDIAETFTAMQLAAKGKLVAFVIQPVMHETGHGYIEVDLAKKLNINHRSNSCQQ